MVLVSTAISDDDDVSSPFRLQTIHANGINFRLATVKGYPPLPSSSSSNSQPFLIVLLHGWPEGWFCWRHQLLALAKAGFSVCAPDLRGFGGTTAPLEVRDYRIDILCQDVWSLARAMGFARILPIGHDFGAYLAWHLAIAALHPESVVAVCGMSVPYMGHSPSREGLLTQLQSTSQYGMCLSQPPYCASRTEQRLAKYHYILHHCLDYAGEQYDANAYEALYRIYFNGPGVPSDPPEYTNKKMFLNNHDDDNHVSKEETRTTTAAADTAATTQLQQLLDARSAPGMWARLPRPKAFPEWQSEQEFSYMLQQYKRSGFAGGLNWYKVMDANWLYLRQYYKTKRDMIVQPSLFVIGKDDRNILKLHGGLDNIVRGMKKHCNNGDIKVVALEGTGHWCQQERPKEVNRELLTFVQSFMTNKASRL